jgi:hypothetical protein
LKPIKQTLVLLFAAVFALVPVLSVPAQASTIFVEEVVQPSKYSVRGTPNSIVFSTTGTYTFKVDFGGSYGFTLWQTTPLPIGETQVRVPSASFDSNTQTIRVGGLSVTKRPTSGNEEGIWYGGDSFSLVIGNVNATGGFVRSQKIMNTSGNVVSRVTRNSLVSFELLVADPNRTPNQYREGSAHVMITGGSFSEDDINLPIKVEKASVPVDGVSRLGFKIVMPRMRYSGANNVLAFSVVYKDNIGESHALHFSTEWSECVEGDLSPSDDYTEDGERLDPITPYIIVESFNYGGTSVMGGEDFELELILRNTSTQYTLQNVVMNITPTGVYNLTDSSNTYYLKNIFAGASVMRTIKLRADLNAATSSSETPKANAVDVNFTYQYVANDARMSGSSSETITIPVTFPDRLEINTDELPTNAYAGENCDIYLPIINKGRTTAYNVSATIIGDIDTPGRSVYIGNVANGEENSVDFTVTFSGEGRKNCEVILTYEDANMNPLSKSVVFAVEVEPSYWMIDPGPIDPGFEIPVDAPPAFKLPAMAYIAGAAVCALSAYLTVARAKARRSELLDEDI